ncbi:MAG: hypothetical protein LBS69_01010 [Prevotellaceae bacterium]|jgi:hypothetical protein|nr:hypothetical protein [Prevotellaceae bacterium]
MKNKLLTVLCLSFFGLSCFAQNLSDDYKVIHVGKQVKDIAYDNPYASPLENYIARIHLWIEGKYDTIYSGMTDAIVRQLPQKPYSQKAAEFLLGSEIEQVVIYKDSIGFAFRKEKNSDIYLVGASVCEDGKWLGNREGYCFAKNMNELKQYIEDNSIRNLNSLRQYNRQQIVSTDTLAFINYLKMNGQFPVNYLIDKLKNHKLVIYGELHFRKNSWDLLQQLVRLPEFSENTGTVFLELSKNAQPELDQFFKNQTKDTNIILNIFRKEEINGWNDKGMYDFLLELWDVNHKFTNKINVIATDMPRLFYRNITSNEQCDSIYRTTCDRNEIMTETILNTINNSQDKRNNLFIVGWGHAYKSPAKQLAGWQINGLSAGFLLSDKIGKENVFSIFTHSPNMSNNGVIFGKLRKGLFDCVFEQNGNIPIAFNLYNSPFGNELFDAADIRFDIQTGTFADNFDGYIFLQSLHEEVKNIPLYELYSDDFVEEIKRRARVCNIGDIFGIHADDITKEKIHEILTAYMKENDNKRFWFDNK